MYIEDYKEMIGAKVKALYVNEVKVNGYTLYDLNQLALETDKGIFVVTIEGDCCSTGYIDHVGFSPYDLEGAEIKNVVELQIPEIELANTSQEVDQIYGLRIELVGSQNIVVEYRNSSNGYYGSDDEIRKIDNLKGFVKLEESF